MSKIEVFPSVINYYNIIVNDNAQVFFTEDNNGRRKEKIEIKEIEKQLKEIFNIKKRDNIKLAERYSRLGTNEMEKEYYSLKSYRLEKCSEFLEFARIEGKYKVIRTTSCRVRMCPMCAYKRSLAVYRNVRDIHDYVVKSVPHSKFLFLTFTVENVSGYELRNTIDSLNKGFQNIIRQKAFKKISLGTIRTIEITYNRKTGKFHPHLHVLLHTTNDLYCGRNYITQTQLTEMWRNAAGLEYTPIVDIRRFRNDTGRELAEVAKYSVKPVDYINAPDSVIMTFDDVLHRRRLLTASGSFREAKKALKIKELEERDEFLKNLKDIEGEIILYKWHFGEKRYKLAVESADKLLKVLDVMKKKSY